METIENSRLSFEKLGRLYPPQPEVLQEYEEIAGVSCKWFIPRDIAGKEIVLYLHGGGFIYGSLDSHSALVSHIAHSLCRKMLLIDYRLAPEHPFPAGLEDILKVISGLLGADPDLNYAIVGDSAGGNLTLSAALSLKQSGVPGPRFQVVISPFVNLECNYPSYESKRELDPVLSKEFCQYVVSLYLGARSLKDPLASPIFGDLAGLSPTLILCGTDEILADDSEHLHQALLEAGVEVVYEVFDNATHVWMLPDVASPNARKALITMKAFADRNSKILLHGKK